MSNVIAVKFPWFGESSISGSMDSSELKPASLMGVLEDAIRESFNCRVYVNGDRMRLDFDDEAILVSIGKPPRKNARGIHLTDGFDDASDLKWRVSDAIETAIRDGFDVIWIHELTIKGDNSDVKSTSN